MTIKLIGAAFVMIACGGFGFSIAATHKKAERALQSILRAIEFMINDLEYHNTPLPELLRKASTEAGEMIAQVFIALSQQLDGQMLPDVNACMKAVLVNFDHIPVRAHRNLMYLGQSMGRFALSGQLSGFRSAAAMCKRDLESLAVDRDARLRSYRTLGICGGIALVILFL